MERKITKMMAVVFMAMMMTVFVGIVSAASTENGNFNFTISGVSAEFKAEATSYYKIEPGKYVHIHFSDCTNFTAKDHGRIEIWDKESKGGKVDIRWEEHKANFTGQIDSSVSEIQLNFNDTYGELEGHTISAPFGGKFSGEAYYDLSNFTYRVFLKGYSKDPFITYGEKVAYLGNFTIVPADEYPTKIWIDWEKGYFEIYTYEYLYSENIGTLDIKTQEIGPLLMSVHCWGYFYIFEPEVSISTDTFKYSPSDTMTVTLNIANPTEDSVTFQWYWGVPQYRIWLPVTTSAYIPAGYDDTVVLNFTIPDWGSRPFGNVFYVQLLDATGEVLDADAACWAYSPSGEAMPEEKVDIAKEIKKTIEMIE